jgi:poly-beta-1,6-N-acetyl-D-glucosamine biosynthesis protein PgaD
LQSLQKRIGGIFVWAVCWLMWIYLLVPLITLASWLLGDYTLADEMRWFGGYKSLLELLQIYFVTLLALTILWLAWVCYHSLRKHAIPTAADRTVNNNDLCAFYQVKIDELERCRHSQLTTVYFDDQGQIIHLESEFLLTKQFQSHAFPLKIPDPLSMDH